MFAAIILPSVATFLIRLCLLGFILIKYEEKTFATAAVSRPHFDSWLSYLENICHFNTASLTNKNPVFGFM